MKTLKTLLITACALMGSMWCCGAAPLEKDFVAYLFVYFTGNAVEEEQIHFAISPDGYRYFALNGNRPVMASDSISETGGVRDPHILRTVDGEWFYMVATDMTSSKGWDSNRGMVLMKSSDLVHWTSSVVNIQQQYEGQEDLLRVWAPQTIYDPKAGKYLVYWSMKHGDGSDIIYYAYANTDFTGLEEAPKQLFFPRDGKSCIDADIISKDGIFHMFYKTEGHGNGIRKAMTDDLTGGCWIEQPGYKQQTDEAVEGSCVFKLANEDKYLLMYDVYMNGRYQFCESLDLDRFRVADHAVSMDFHPRHGTVMPITKKELRRLTDRWGMPTGYPPLPANPVLEGYYADPDILYSEQTDKYYIYPTSDGYEGWGGTYFKAFSSVDLKEWTDEGIVLDLQQDVDWAKRNAWAPCIIEKKVGRNKYKYYYYFTAAQRIGVAVGDNPTGPFADSGKPLVDFKPAGVTGGQEIDPEVFHDPVSGKDYLYWGNGYLAVAELRQDMVSLKPGSVRVLTPDATFREAVTVFYRDGLYYFLWSENDTRDADYRVRYATSLSPLGPLDIPVNNIVLAKDTAQGIFATGHNSVLHVPESDEWYIVYHRFSHPNGISMGRAAGWHREVCIDRMSFAHDGRLLPVCPSK